MRSAFKRLVAIIIIAPLLAACQEPEIAMPTPSAEAVQVEESSTGGLVEPAATATTPSIAPPATATPTAVASESEETATAEPEATGTATPAPTSEAVVEELLLSDDFTDSGSGWPALQRYDNYYIGYHEPEWYHVEVQVPNDFAPVVLEGQIFEDVTAEAEVFVETSLSENTGDFRYGLVLRRAGKQFYAFTVSPRTRTWAILKSSPTLLETLAEGSNETISGLDEADTLRVDAAGSTFAFHINGEVVGEVHDGDYPGGELGFFVQTFDSERVHIHYDTLRVAVPRDESILLSDNFTDSGSGWPALQRYDNYYIGYHEPEWYHVEVQVPNDFAPVVREGQIFEDVTAEAEVFVETSLSEDTGDFRYGLVLRRAGKQFYAFTVSPRTRTWAILKSSPTLLETLAEGSNETISGLDEADTLRVDAAGSTFAFHINGEVVGEVHDGDYPGGELGFFVQTFDSERVHIHYESLSVREVDAPPARCTVTVRELNLRPGPGASPPEGVLYQGTSLIPLTRSAFPPWIQVQVEDGGQTGWVYAVPQYVSCNFDLSILPLP